MTSLETAKLTSTVQPTINLDVYQIKDVTDISGGKAKGVPKQDRERERTPIVCTRRPQIQSDTKSGPHPYL